MNKVYKDRQSLQPGLTSLPAPSSYFYKIHRHLSTVPDACSLQRKQTLNPCREVPNKTQDFTSRLFSCSIFLDGDPGSVTTSNPRGSIAVN